MRSSIAALVFSVALGALAQTGCRPTPPAGVAPGATGLFVRAIPAKGGLTAEARAGIVSRPDKWPPAATDECKEGVFEDKQLAEALGFSLEPLSCPWAEAADVRGAQPPNDAVSNGDVEIPATDGFQVSCHVLGAWVIVLETTTRVGHCSHVVGVSLFPGSPAK